MVYKNCGKLSPIEYLNLLYGKDWRQPQPNFKHDWSGKGYGDILP